MNATPRTLTITGPARIFYLDRDSDRYRNKQVTSTASDLTLDNKTKGQAHTFCRFLDGSPCWVSPENLT